MHAQLVAAICRRIPDAGPVALLGPPSVAAQIKLRAPAARLVLVGNARLSRRRPALPALCGDPGALPLRYRSLEAIIAVRALSRADDPAELLHGWALVLRPSGQLIVAEHALPLAPWRRHLAPEQLTAAFLNVGLADIGQVFQGGALLTWGRWDAPRGAAACS